MIIPPQSTSSILLAVDAQPQKQGREDSQEPAAKVDLRDPRPVIIFFWDHLRGAIGVGIVICPSLQMDDHGVNSMVNSRFDERRSGCSYC